MTKQVITIYRLIQNIISVKTSVKLFLKYITWKGMLIHKLVLILWAIAPVTSFFFFFHTKYDIFSYFSIKTYVAEALLMSTHNICFCGETWQLFIWKPLLSGAVNEPWCEKNIFYDIHNQGRFKLTLVLLNKLRCHAHFPLIFSQSDYLIQIVDINLNT